MVALFMYTYVQRVQPTKLIVWQYEVSFMAQPSEHLVLEMFQTLGLEMTKEKLSLKNGGC